MRRGDTLTVITKEPTYHFVPSNPWVAVSWRKQEDIEVDLAPVMRQEGHRLQAVARRASSIPRTNRIELETAAASTTTT